MNRITLITAGALAALVITGCQRDDRAELAKLQKDVETLSARVERLEKAPRAAAPAGAPARPQRPEPGVLYAVPAHADDLQRGPADAKVTIVEAYEYACPYCFQVAPLMDQALAAYPSDVRVVSKPFIVHPEIATKPALASCAANQQGKFAAYEHALWEKSWPDNRMNRDAFTDEALVALAKDLGLDTKRFTADMEGDTCKQLLDRTRREMAAIGVRGTPTIYVNGKPYVGGRTIDALKPVIDEEIAAANAAIANGTPAASYYQSLVAKGKKSL